EPIRPYQDRATEWLVVWRAAIAKVKRAAEPRHVDEQRYQTGNSNRCPQQHLLPQQGQPPCALTQPNTQHGERMPRWIEQYDGGVERKQGCRNGQQNRLGQDGDRQRRAAEEEPARLRTARALQRVSSRQERRRLQRLIEVGLGVGPRQGAEAVEQR